VTANATSKANST
jgi:hypothetical protein